MNADGSGRTQLTDGEREEGPAWSPDGSRIAYIGISSDSTSHVFVMNADGSGQTPLTSLGRQSDFLSPVPAWSPDGTRIAYSGLLPNPPGDLRDQCRRQRGDPTDRRSATVVQPGLRMGPGLRSCVP